MKLSVTKLTRWIFAIIPLPNDVNWTEFGFGPFQELLFDVDPPSVPIGFQDDLRCTKLGISSGRTKAAIVERGAHIDLGGVSFRDVIIVDSSNFLISGDSGALLVSIDDNGNEVPEGILFGSNEVEDVAYAFSLDNMQTAAGLSQS